MSRNPNRCPAHPGEVLREDVIPAVGKAKAEIARMLGISRQHLHDILAERKPVSPEVAVRLAKLFSTEPLLWIRMQGAYDAWHATRDVDVSAIPTLRAIDSSSAGRVFSHIRFSSWTPSEGVRYQYHTMSHSVTVEEKRREERREEEREES